MAVLPVKSANFPVTVGGSGGITQFTPTTVVGCLYNFRRELTNEHLFLECQRRRYRHLQVLPAEESHGDTARLPSCVTVHLR